MVASKSFLILLLTKTAETAKTEAKETKTTAKKPAAKKVEAKEEKDTSRKPIYRIVYDKEARLWLIKKDGAKRTITSFVTKQEALDRVEQLSKSNDVNFIVHKKDGKFQKKK